MAMSEEIKDLLPSPAQLKLIRKRTRDRNYRFKKMPPNRQRVAIARDVIKALDQGRFIAAQMGYLSIGKPRRSGEYGFTVPKAKRSAATKLKELFKLSMEEWIDSDLSNEAAAVPLNEVLVGVPCTVCGIAACFVAAVDKVDGITVGDMGGSIANDGAMRDFLGKWFSLEQVGLIECAFEKDASHMQSASYSDGDDAAHFGRAFPDPKERLIAIMRNIIRNDGTFDPAGALQ